jgi:hypothetical protein
VNADGCADGGIRDRADVESRDCVVLGHGSGICPLDGVIYLRGFYVEDGRLAICLMHELTIVSHYLERPCRRSVAHRSPDLGGAGYR